VNTFLAHEVGQVPVTVELARATEQEKQSQLDRLAKFHELHRREAPAALKLVQEAASTGGNVFEALMHAVRHCSLGQITNALFEVGGQYRRNI
jgi:methylmalonyl-CoA mutase